ncbi:MAG: polysaccharide biosynthesis protein, partial [SAR324 cluster bacterium]|nr:polysaccharide biosynthesis protein [SAR324 cluster bacterium]
MRWLAYDLQLLHPVNHAQERIIIYGAGSAGVQLATALKQEGHYRVVAFVDDSLELQKHHVQGMRVYPLESLKELIENYGIKIVLLAIPSVSRQRKAEIVRHLKTLNIQIKTVPGVGEILSEKVSIQTIRDIDIMDLLGRQEVLPHPELLQINIKDKVVMVTGAGGSIGSELCRQIAQQEPRSLILYERNEFALYSIDLDLSENYSTLQKVPCIGSVTDEMRLREVMTEHKVETLYHAAAYKHVPLIEQNMSQGILNNIEGTLKVAQACMAEQVKTCVLVSTDKAVRPTNVMGATKRVAELILQALAIQEKNPTRFMMVRFGNVLDSAGSVVPLFRDQIRKGKPLTVTHPEITRYFMSIPEASRLVIQAGAMGKGGDVFLLDMGEPVKIYDLAVQMIELSGLKLGEDAEIQITGLRPGEKLYEELLIEQESAVPTDHPKIFTAKEQMMPWSELSPLVNKLLIAAKNNQLGSMIWALQGIVPEYQPPANVEKRIDKDETIFPLASDLPVSVLSLEAPELDELKKYIREGRVLEAQENLEELKGQLPIGMQMYFEGAIHGNRQESRQALKCYLTALSQLNSIPGSDDRDYIYIRTTRAVAITKCKLGEDYDGAVQLLDELMNYPAVQHSAQLVKQVRITRTVIHYYKGDYQTVIEELGWFVTQCSPNEHISLSQAYLFLALS